MSKMDAGLVVPMPTLPLPCCRTNCEPPIVNPCPPAMVVVPAEVMFVVLAPPFIENKPLVTVEEALERNPLVNVASPVCDSVPAITPEFADRTPKDADMEYRFVLDAVVEKRLVEVALPAE